MRLEEPTTTITELYITLSPPLLRVSREPAGSRSCIVAGLEDLLRLAEMVRARVRT